MKEETNLETGNEPTCITIYKFLLVLPSVLFQDLRIHLPSRAAGFQIHQAFHLNLFPLSESASIGAKGAVVMGGV